MIRTMATPSGDQDGPYSLLRSEHFQCAYVTSDLGQACNVFRKRFGISNFSFLEGPFPAGGTIHVAFAWAGGTMYEIIDAKGPGAEFYLASLPGSGFAIRFHHLGYLLDGEESWSALQLHFAKANWPIAFESRNTGFMDAMYVHAPELGHHLEYILAEKAGMEFFEAVPGV